MSLLEWAKGRQIDDRVLCQQLYEALSVACEALEKIEQRKLEDLENDKKRDEFHKTLMATAAWIFCMFTAKDAIRRIEELGQ